MELGTSIEEADPALAANALSASAMWAANAATVSPSPDTADGRCHLTVANLKTMPHRSHEWPATLAQLRLAFGAQSFAVHGPIPPAFGDEGAANHMRLSATHGEPGAEVFVYGISGGAFPARQHLEASRAVARLHRLDPERLIFAEQSEAAIAAGAFHNDVVAVANERVLFAHEQAFADKAPLIAKLDALVPGFEYVEVPAAEVPLEDAVRSYLFNALLVTTPDGPTLVVPTEARATVSVWRWIERHLAGNGPIRRVEVVDVRQSMANGGGPACLRLRVVADPSTIDARFLADEAKLDRIADVVRRYWPEQIHHDDLQHPALIADIEGARAQLLDSIGLAELM
jgi:succinylarginine dihydrolase